jgi:hypothetical protein
MTIEKEVIPVLQHGKEAYGITAATLMARAIMTALDALNRTRMDILGRGDPTVDDSSKTGAISASVASLILRSGSTSLLKRCRTNLLKGAAMRWSQRTNDSEIRLDATRQMLSVTANINCAC